MRTALVVCCTLTVLVLLFSPSLQQTKVYDIYASGIAALIQELRSGLLQEKDAAQAQTQSAAVNAINAALYAEKLKLELDYTRNLQLQLDKILRVKTVFNHITKNNLQSDYLYGKVPTAPGKSCNDIMAKNNYSTSGIFWIELPNLERVFCDMDTLSGGWLLFARKAIGYSQPLSFDKNVNRDYLVDRSKSAAVESFDITLLDSLVDAGKWEVAIHFFNSSDTAFPAQILVLNPNEHVIQALKPSENRALFSRELTIPSGLKCIVVENVYDLCRVEDIVDLHLDFKTWDPKYRVEWFIRRKT